MHLGIVVRVGLKGQKIFNNGWSAHGCTQNRSHMQPTDEDADCRYHNDVHVHQQGQVSRSSARPCLLRVAIIILSAVGGTRRCAFPRRGCSRHVGCANRQPMLRRVRRQACQLCPRDAGELPRPHPKDMASVALAPSNQGM